MARDEIMNMPAGREMDALIAERVMGWFWKTEGYTRLGFMDGDRFRYGVIRGGGEADEYSSNLPYYSTDIAAAWEVVDAICIPAPEDCWTGPTFQLNHDKSEPHAWQAIFSNLDSLDGIKPWCGKEYTDVHAATAPLAICRAALLTVIV